MAVCSFGRDSTPFFRPVPSGLRFRPAKVQEVIHQVLKSNLTDKTYSTEEALKWSQTISDEVKAAVKELGLERCVLRAAYCGCGCGCWLCDYMHPDDCGYLQELQEETKERRRKEEGG